MIARVLRMLRIRRAGHKLDKIVRANRESYAVQSYAKHRAAAKLGIARRIARSQAMFTGEQG